jgi:hypothetical protein
MTAHKRWDECQVGHTLVDRAEGTVELFTLTVVPGLNYPQWVAHDDGRYVSFGYDAWDDVEVR